MCQWIMGDSTHYLGLLRGAGAYCIHIVTFCPPPLGPCPQDLNFFIASLACSRFSSGSQVSSLGGYPFQWTRNQGWPWYFLSARSGQVFGVVMPQFSSEPWFKPDFPWTGLWSSSRFRLEHELDLWPSSQFLRPSNLVNAFRMCSNPEPHYAWNLSEWHH